MKQKRLKKIVIAAEDGAFTLKQSKESERKRSSDDFEDEGREATVVEAKDMKRS